MLYLGQDTINSLTVPIFPQLYKLGIRIFNAGEQPCDGIASHPGGVEILPVT